MGTSAEWTPQRRGRALALLALFFVVGGLAGAALDRAYVRRSESEARAAREENTRRANAEREKNGNPGGVEADRIPTPLERLGLTPAEKDSLRMIARKYRPQATQIVAQIRFQVADVENSMFAEMLCVLTPAQRETYEKSLTGDVFDKTVVEKRFALVRGNKCGVVKPK